MGCVIILDHWKRFDIINNGLKPLKYKQRYIQFDYFYETSRELWLDTPQFDKSKSSHVYAERNNQLKFIVFTMRHIVKPMIYITTGH